MEGWFGGINILRVGKRPGRHATRDHSVSVNASPDTYTLGLGHITSVLSILRAERWVKGINARLSQCGCIYRRGKD